MASPPSNFGLNQAPEQFPAPCANHLRHSSGYIVLNLYSIGIFANARKNVFLNELALSPCNAENQVVQRSPPENINMLPYSNVRPTG